eukprot:553494_1
MRKTPIVTTPFGPDNDINPQTAGNTNPQTAGNDHDIVYVVNTMIDLTTKGNESNEEYNQDIVDEINANYATTGKHKDTINDENVTIKPNENDYERWDIKQVYEWTMMLDDGALQIYSDTLWTNLQKENVDGSCVMLLNEDDLHRLGIYQLKHKKSLLKQIEKLTQREGC